MKNRDVSIKKNKALLQSDSNIAIVVLAAGEASRMGSPKQLLSWGEGSLITHVVQQALCTSSSEVIVVLGAHFEAVHHTISDFPITILHNQNWQAGLSESIACAAQYLLKENKAYQGALFLLADQPLVSSEYINMMIEKFKPHQKCILTSTYTDGKKGVPVLFDACYFKGLIELSAHNGAHHFIKNQELFVQSINMPFENLDIDTKQDYITLYQRYFGSK
ncbi:hypothetical protein C1A40_16695 [Tamlana carrageenivorans]|uniref:MobA-like NTP transferase domain-containing protein n=1 Tax=Pseudotamlana carrageenivorans TaxID=2069432 RepID=A0A2I7SM52_9FLAO|nr:hypothetical protein C1A40_16695 [Tamlana carrageenivorans]